MCPTTGECPTVFYDDKIRLFEAVLEAVNGRCKTIAYVGDNCTQDTVDFAKKVEPMGFDGYLCVVPYYNKPPQEGLYRHYSAIANAVDVPIMLYNIPGRSVINMTAETIPEARQRSREHHRDQGGERKDGPDCRHSRVLRPASPYIPETTPTRSRSWGLGGVGVVSTIANVAPKRMKEIVELEAAGRHDEALAAHARAPAAHERALSPRTPSW